MDGELRSGRSKWVAGVFQPHPSPTFSKILVTKEKERKKPLKRLVKLLSMLATRCGRQVIIKTGVPAVKEDQERRSKLFKSRYSRISNKEKIIQTQEELSHRTPKGSVRLPHSDKSRRGALGRSKLLEPVSCPDDDRLTVTIRLASRNHGGFSTS